MLNVKYFRYTHSENKSKNIIKKIHRNEVEKGKPWQQLLTAPGKI